MVVSSDGKDLAAFGIDREMEFAPGPLATLTMLLGQPFAGAVHLQPGRVDHDVNRSRPLGLRQRTGERQAGAAPGEGRVVGNADGQTEQGGQRAQQPFGLPPGPTKGQAQQVPGLDGDVCILRRPASPARLGRMPRRSASGVTHTVRLPRCWSALSYSGQLVTL